MPPMGAPAAIEVLPEFGDGLLRLEKHSHVWVLSWLDQVDRDLLRVIPRGVAQTDPDALHGVFAVRSPARPNPIGLTATQVIGIDGLRIDVDPLDFLDGTPVMDLKPYFSSRDLVFSAANAQIGRPVNRVALRESLRRQALNFHGESCGDLAFAVRAVEHFRAEVLRMDEPPAWRVTAPFVRPCVIDAIMGMTRVSPGRGTLLLEREDSLRFEHHEWLYEYVPVTGPRAAPATILAAPDEEIFRFEKRPR